MPLPKYLADAVFCLHHNLPVESSELSTLTLEVLETLVRTIGSNSKVLALPCWNLPPVVTCPSATALQILREEKGIEACRIHTGGDFYSLQYMRSIRIAFQYSRVKPIVFTRAWRMDWFWTDEAAPERAWLKRYGFVSVDPSTSEGSRRLLAAMGFRIATASPVKLQDYKSGKVKAPAQQTCLAQLGIRDGYSRWVLGLWPLHRRQGPVVQPGVHVPRQDEEVQVDGREARRADDAGVPGQSRSHRSQDRGREPGVPAVQRRLLAALRSSQEVVMKACEWCGEPIQLEQSIEVTKDGTVFFVHRWCCEECQHCGATVFPGELEQEDCGCMVCKGRCAGHKTRPRPDPDDVRDRNRDDREPRWTAEVGIWTE